MQTKAKTNSIVTHAIAASGDTIDFTVRGAGTFAFDMTRVAAAITRRAALHGFIQRISDGAAISRDPATGLPATPEAKLARMKAIAEHYMSGTEEWAMRAKAPARLDYDPIVIRALCELFTAEFDAMLAKCRAQSEVKGMKLSAYLAHAATTERMKVIVERLRLEAAGPSVVDSDELLDELGE